MDFNRDEIRRQLRAVDADNTQVMPRWRELLDRVFSGGVDLSLSEKAELLGVPGRRQFFKVGGATLAGAALLAACGDDDDERPADGVLGTDTTQGDPGDGNGNMDVVLANTAISLEVLAVDAYTTVIDSGLVEQSILADAAQLFREHHRAHADALIAVVEAAGATPFTTANPLVKSQMVDPAVASATSEADLVQIAFDLERAAAQTYVFAATALSTPQLRSTIMTIGGVESRHATILGQLADYDTSTVFPGAFFPSDNPLPDDAMVTG